MYASGSEPPGDFLDNLVKLDLERGTASSWREEGCFPGEPVFVAAPETSSEDDGVILSVVLDTRRAASFLMILDASTFGELARAELPHHIPFGFHGHYFYESRKRRKEENMARIATASLDTNDTFPQLELQLVSGGRLKLPEGGGEEYGVVLIYRGHW